MVPTAMLSGVNKMKKKRKPQKNHYHQNGPKIPVKWQNTMLAVLLILAIGAIVYALSS